MRQPEIYTPTKIKDWDVKVEVSRGKWVPARPMGRNVFQFFWRWKVAFSVLIGKYDALKWERQ